MIWIEKSEITTLLIGWKQPFIIEGQKNIGSDRVLTPEKAPYKVEGYYFHSRRGQMTVFGGYHLREKSLR